jgi:hypothetical protein
MNRSIQTWLTNICLNEHPDESIIAYNIGIFQTPEGFSLYMIGSQNFDANDSDWATEIEFEPEEKYFVLSDDFSNLDWDQVQYKSIHAIQEFMKMDVFKTSFLAKAKAITIGFDDGDLVRLK